MLSVNEALPVIGLKLTFLHRPASVATAISSLSSASSAAAANISEDEKRRILEEEQRQIEYMKVVSCLCLCLWVVLPALPAR